MVCGTLCPTTMTYGAVAAMRRDAWLDRDWVPRLLTRDYDPRDIPIEHKRGGLIGMGMTEKQGGSDVRANTTRAVRSADGSHRITGHKWFFSAPQCDAHLVLAQTDRGLSCFFMPRRLPDGTLNGIYSERLKDKLGNSSNASSEVEFIDAWAYLMGEEGRGIPTILEMGTYTRLDCVTGTAGMMRQAVVQAVHHARHRKAFGALLIHQPLMQSVLADLAVESEAATALAMRLARAFDGDADDEMALRLRSRRTCSHRGACAPLHANVRDPDAGQLAAGRGERCGRTRGGRGILRDSIGRRFRLGCGVRGQQRSARRECDHGSRVD